MPYHLPKAAFGARFLKAAFGTAFGILLRGKVYWRRYKVATVFPVGSLTFTLTVISFTETTFGGEK